MIGLEKVGDKKTKNVGSNVGSINPTLKKIY